MPATEIDKPTRKLTRMSTSREYEVVLTPDAEGGFSVTVPALPGCTSQGESREEALSMIREAIFPLERPNGIGLSPDEKTLYVVETPTARCWCAGAWYESANRSGRA